MGAHENADVVRGGYEAFNAADLQTLTELFDESASWHTPGRSPVAGDHEGREAASAQFGRYGGQTGGTFKANLQHVLTSDDGRVVGVHNNIAERNGKRPGRWLLHRLRGQGRPHHRRPRGLQRPLRLGRVLLVAPTARAR